LRELFMLASITSSPRQRYSMPLSIPTNLAVSGSSIKADRFLSQQTDRAIPIMHFGNSAPNLAMLKGKTVIAPSVEFDDHEIDALVGGLGVASKLIPSLMSKYLGMEPHIILPASRGIDARTARWTPLLEEGNLIEVPTYTSHFEKFGPLFHRKRQEDKLYFQLYKTQYTDPDNEAKMAIYAIGDLPEKNGGKTYFKQFPHMYLGHNPKLGQAAYQQDHSVKNTIAAVTLFNRAAAEATRKLLDPSLKGHIEHLDAILIHGSLLSPYAHMLKQLEPEKFNSAGRVFVIHASEDFILAKTQKLREFLSLPTFMPNWFNRSNRKQEVPKEQGSFSWLTAGFGASHAIMTDKNFSIRMAESYQRIFGDNPISRVLRNPEKTTSFLLDGKSMHYPLTALDPTKTNSTELSVPGAKFTPISPELFAPKKDEPVSFTPIQAYKTKNKAALYNMLEALPRTEQFKGHVYGHLDRQNNSRVFSFFGRLSPSKKGEILFADAIEQFLLEHPHTNAQFIASSHTLNQKKSQERLQDLAKRFPGKFVYISGQPNRKILMGGSDFGVVPSLSEGFGLVQLEYMGLATPIVAHPIEGLKSTIDSSRAILVKPALTEKEVSDYSRHIYPKLYGTRHSSWSSWNPWHKPEPSGGEQAEQKAVTALKEAFTKGMSLSNEKVLQMSLDACRYVAVEHSPKTIAEERFAPPFIHAIEQSKLHEK
jgi:glycosyltransferase involved in cell wall biosynthesis